MMIIKIEPTCYYSNNNNNIFNDLLTHNQLINTKKIKSNRTKQKKNYKIKICSTIRSVFIIIIMLLC